MSPVERPFLNNSFGAVLERAGATPQEVTNLQDDMNEIAKVDSLSIHPSTLAREDYSLVLQTTLAVGRPMITPTAPTLQAKDGIKIDGGRAGLTTRPHPDDGRHLPGRGDEGQRGLDPDRRPDTGQVYGTVPVNPAGTYTIKLNYLADGTYYLSARSSDEVGHLSARE